MVIDLLRTVPRLGALVSLVVMLAGPLSAQEQNDTAIARRVTDIATIALSEYRLGMGSEKGGGEREFEESRRFVQDATAAAGQLSPTSREAAVPLLSQLADGIAARRSPGQLAPVLRRLRGSLTAVLGVALDPVPEKPPSLERGARVYAERCAQCHGASGAGNGPMAPSLSPRPADLRDLAALHDASVLDFLRRVNVGIAGTAMPGFADALPIEDRWAVALYASQLRYSPETIEAGRDAVANVCASCQVLLSDFSATEALSDDSLRALVAAGAQGALGDSALTAITAYARVAGAVEQLGADRRLAAQRAVQQSKELMWEATDAARRGDTEAASQRAVDAYLAFERIETAVRARDPSAAARVETAFRTLRTELGRPNGVSDPLRLSRDVEAALDGAITRLTGLTVPSVLFGQSLVIILREGLEAILIIGALVAFLSKAGASERKRDLGRGATLAGVASLATAVLFATVFRAVPAHRETLEGGTMLVAAGVLFFVSYWLVSKIEVRRWQDFVRSRMLDALSSRRSWALASVAFLAVYREGFETVLFYAALFTSGVGTPAATTAILGGLLTGGMLLAGVYVAIERFGARVPLRPFFAVTSALLYLMAFSFAGQGVAELQEAGVVSATPLGWLPAVPALGIFPTWQTAVSQGVVALALACALVWVFWVEPFRARAGVAS